MRTTLAILLTLILACPANADHGPPAQDWLTIRSLRAAYVHWGRAMPPCWPHGTVADFGDSFDQARGEMPGCRFWVSKHTDRRPAVRFCSIVVHEYGHNLGFPHSPEATSAMNPAFADLGLVPACRRTFRRCRVHRHKFRRHKHCRTF